VEHVVFYTGADGAAQHSRVASLDDAVALVGHLRNSDGVEDSRVYSLTEVPLTVKAVYVVEVPGAASAPAAETPAPESAPAPVAEAPAAVVEPEVVEAPAPEVSEVAEVAAPAAEVVPEPVVETIADPLSEMTVPVMEPVAEAPAPVVEEPVKVEAGANGSSRGLGFFAR
jgi:hypothetical protein